MVMENGKQKNIFIIKTFIIMRWHDTYHKNIHYKSFSLPPISTANQTGRKDIAKCKSKKPSKVLLEWALIHRIKIGNDSNSIKCDKHLV